MLTNSVDPRVDMFTKFIDENNDLPPVWLCVGTNKGQDNATWFYTLYTYEAAKSFVERAMQFTDSVTWDVAPYPCEIDDADSAFEVFVMAINEKDD